MLPYTNAVGWRPQEYNQFDSGEHLVMPEIKPESVGAQSLVFKKYLYDTFHEKYFHELSVY